MNDIAAPAVCVLEPQEKTFNSNIATAGQLLNRFKKADDDSLKRMAVMVADEMSEAVEKAVAAGDPPESVIATYPLDPFKKDKEAMNKIKRHLELKGYYCELEDYILHTFLTPRHSTKKNQ